MLDATLIVDLQSLEGLQPEWDALAVANALPLMSPAWIISWWTHLAPPTAEPRVVTASEHGKLVGLAPFFVERNARFGRTDYRLPGIELSARLAPLSVPGREWQVAEAIGHALVSAEPRPDVVALEGVPAASHWLRALRQTWPAPLRPAARQYSVHSCPTISLREESFDAWLAGKSTNFRSQMRRLRRQFDAADGTIRLSTEDTLNCDVDTFVRLHSSRWQGRGTSNLVAFGDRLAPMLKDVGRRLLGERRFDLRLLEIDGEPASAQLFLRAGGGVLYMNGGWNERYAQFKPSMLGILAMIDDAFERHDKQIDLGLGEQAYKLRFADGSDPVAWSVLLPPRGRMPLTAARVTPLLVRSAMRDMVKRTLTDEQINHLQTLRSRVIR